MTSLPSETDAGLYSLIHQVVGLTDQGTQEQRREARRPFPARQRIAPHGGQAVPADSAFVSVECHDLTRGGFSFLWPDTPDFRSLVAAFGKPPQVIYVSAEVLHWAEVLVHPTGAVEPLADAAAGVGGAALPHRAARRMVLVGCRFVRRLYPERAGDGG